jgi:hypothetical protein
METHCVQGDRRANADFPLSHCLVPDSVEGSAPRPFDMDFHDFMSSPWSQGLLLCRPA